MNLLSWIVIGAAVGWFSNRPGRNLTAPAAWRIVATVAAACGARWLTSAHGSVPWAAGPGFSILAALGAAAAAPLIAAAPSRGASAGQLTVEFNAESPSESLTKTAVFDLAHIPHGPTHGSRSTGIAEREGSP